MVFSFSHCVLFFLSQNAVITLHNSGVWIYITFKGSYELMLVLDEKIVTMIDCCLHPNPSVDLFGLVFSEINSRPLLLFYLPAIQVAIDYVNNV